MTWEGIPGFVSVKEAFGETTVTVEREQIAEACAHAREGNVVNVVLAPEVARAGEAVAIKCGLPSTRGTGGSCIRTFRQLRQSR